ncbi:hypothetical protein UFOVP1387_25 [uncultured Caudovirales phage]|uniref:Uncharacterized protein n=1 Tax=uncultured Caudovirales phage TaxID=2100421 RepID=A0A6J5S5V7_9CAUD|nr:hypothetical protein UFOVP1387_25 [uncultured Caudovirales phage]
MAASEKFEVKGQKDQFGKIEIVNYTAFLKAIKQAADDGYSAEIIQKANEEVAKIIIRRANQIATGKMEKRAASTLVQSSNKLRVAVTGGGKAAPFFGGANFGSYRDTRRLIKAPNVRGKRSRATLVRHGEDIDVVARRVENQSVEASGKTISKRLYKEGKVDLARTKTGGYRVIKGWNQFREFQKGRDHFLYRAVSHEERYIMGLYETAIGRVTGEAFPD